VLVLTWIYYSSLILLFGAEFTQVWSRHRGKRIRAEEGAVRVVRETKTIPDGSSAAKQRESVAT
jgi:membrane protein